MAKVIRQKISFVFIPIYCIIVGQMKKGQQIIHLSDLHIGYKDCGSKSAAIVRNIIKSEEPEKTIIIITGDLVETAFNKNHINTALNLINTLRKAGFLVFICPGNHDYGSGFVNSKEIAKMFNKTFLLTETQFPIVNPVGNSLFIGLDSNAEELHWYDRFFADGEIGDAQFEKLKEILANKEYKDMTKIVYLHHHPVSRIPFHKLKDHNKLKEIVKNKIDILLFGHNHIGNSYNEKWGIKIMLDGGSSTGKRVLFKPIHHRKIDLSNFSIQEKNYLNIN